MPTLKSLKSHLENMVRIRDRDLAKFQEKLAKDPVHAFVWADGTMSSIAAGSVADHYLASIIMWEELNASQTLSEGQPQTEEATVEFIRASIFRTALQKARSPKRSSSLCSNYMDQQEAAAYAELASDWELIYG